MSVQGDREIHTSIYIAVTITSKRTVWWVATITIAQLAFTNNNLTIESLYEKLAVKKSV